MERSELPEEKEMEQSVSMAAEDGSSSSIQMVASEDKVAEKQGTTLAPLIKGKESMGVDKEHGSSREKKKVTTTERSVQTEKQKVMEERAEDETSSSSWMQMVAVAKMLEKDLRSIEEMMNKSSADPKQEQKVAEGSALAEKEEEDGSSSSFSSSPSRKMPALFCLMKTGGGLGKESMGRVDEEEEEHDLCEEKEEHDSYSISCSWVVEMQRILEDRERWMRPSIYRVPDWLKSMTKAEAYKPQVVSLGPFHHGEPSLGPMEEQKRRLTLHMVERSKKPMAKFVEAIADVAGKLQDAYYGLDVGWRGHNTARFVDVMVTDGGFLLEFMTTLQRTESVLQAGYAPYDPIFSKRSLLSLWARIRSDMILVENQVPLLALKTLEAVRTDTSPSDAYINDLVTDFICPNLKEIRNQENLLGLHTLEIFHRNFCSEPLKHQDDELGHSSQRETTMLSAEELREAGVHFKRSGTRSVQDIDFNNGVLSMPLVEIDDSSERTFLNLMAFERLHSNAGSVATAYMIFMDNIIDSERDVAVLRSKKVLKNFLSSDKEAADLFNTLGKGATLSSGSRVGHVQWLVAKHCERPWPKLQASFKHTYLRNPWVFFSTVAAITLLALTILQTIYTVVPFYTKN